ncbi:lasso RiPP family leader peptide-containing protein [Halomonas campisalis]|uniref:Lasso RiPP family leader peptide-containing protein n=1 Tax=Billgrantia campisalis TaxID=74661 RepID=A0ABS9P4Y0_9GAMM|nr:lasso RiPP family leader peptide-containing protein [Halomonas campisalis]
MSRNEERQQETLRHYEPPQLKQWGSVSDITQVGLTNPGGDLRQGSVDPGGHEDNPGL